MSTATHEQTRHTISSWDIEPKILKRLIHEGIDPDSFAFDVQEGPTLPVVIVTPAHAHLPGYKVENRIDPETQAQWILIHANDPKDITTIAITPTDPEQEPMIGFYAGLDNAALRVDITVRFSQEPESRLLVVFYKMPGEATHALRVMAGPQVESLPVPTTHPPQTY